MLAHAAKAFETFGGPHLAVMCLTVAMAAGLCVWARRARPAFATWIARAWAVGLLVNEGFYYARAVASLPLADLLRDSLPLHICDIAVFGAAWMLWTRGRRVYEVVYFWSLAGTVQAVLTPNLQFGFPSYSFFEYFLTHCGVVIAAVFATFALRLRPARGAVLRVFVITNAYAAFVGAVNYLVGGNYMFLCAPPAGETPFFFLPWPWYILVLEAFALVMVWLLYLPFVAEDHFRRRRLS